jgi:hypothetical protein
VQNWHSIQVETDYRHLEWERAIAAASRANLARSSSPRAVASWRARFQHLLNAISRLAAFRFSSPVQSQIVQKPPTPMLNGVGCVDAVGIVRQ